MFYLKIKFFRSCWNDPLCTWCIEFFSMCQEQIRCGTPGIILSSAFIIALQPSVKTDEGILPPMHSKNVPNTQSYVVAVSSSRSAAPNTHVLS